MSKPLATRSRPCWRFNLAQAYAIVSETVPALAAALGGVPILIREIVGGHLGIRSGLHGDKRAHERV